MSEDRWARLERLVGPEALRRAREKVRATLRHWDTVAQRNPATRDDQDAGSGSLDSSAEAEAS